MTVSFEFLLTRPSRGVTTIGRITFSNTGFLLTRPSRGVTIPQNPEKSIDIISTHTPLAGRDLLVVGLCLDIIISTHTPLAGRDQVQNLDKSTDEISTHTPLAGRDKANEIFPTDYKISTHTPLAGRDSVRKAVKRHEEDFYSHAPRGA